MHAPVITKFVTVRPANPWLTEEVLAARKKGRAYERHWRNRKAKGLALDVERQIVRNLNKEKRRLLDHEKAAHLNREITEASGKITLYRIVDSFLIKKPSLQMPRHKSLSELADRFSDHFRLKISNIRSNLDAARSLHPAVDVPIDAPPFFSFASVTVPEIVALIKDCPSKSSTRDPSPTSLLKRFADHLASPITTIVNFILPRVSFRMR